MADAQCGLCLSCGVPFFPDLTEVQSFNRAGIQSLVFLNMEYKDNRSIRALYSTPRFSSGRHAAHIFHQSHHATALQYMCDRHTGDADVGVGVPAPNAVIRDANNVPFLYYHAPTSRGDKGAEAAVWARPPAALRLHTRPLLRYLIEAAADPHAVPIAQNLGETISTCDGCNYLMTQSADIRYILGHHAVAGLNTHGPVISTQPITQYPVAQHQQDLATAYGTWTFRNNVAGAPPRPARNQQDSDAPHVAYYLHMCLPAMPPGAANDAFTQGIANPQLRASARVLFLEQCWLLLEIAAMATLVEEGKVTAVNGQLSHGMQQHYGVLDLYVSFFLFRLVQFRYGSLLRGTGVDFVQWHQKYYWDILRCKEMFPRGVRTVVWGQLAYGTTAQPSRALIEQICKRLVAAVRGSLRGLIAHVTGQAQLVPHGISGYFVPVQALRMLRAWSTQVRPDFAHLSLWTDKLTACHRSSALTFTRC